MTVRVDDEGHYSYARRGMELDGIVAELENAAVNNPGVILSIQLTPHAPIRSFRGLLRQIGRNRHQPCVAGRIDVRRSLLPHRALRSTRQFSPANLRHFFRGCACQTNRAGRRWVMKATFGMLLVWPGTTTTPRRA